MIYLLFGDNAYAKQQALLSLIADIQQKYGIEAVERFDGETLEPRQLSNILQGTSLFSTNKLVVITDASKNKSLWLHLEQWIETPIQGADIALIETTPDRRTKTFKLLQKQANVKEYKQLTESEAAQWLVQVAKERDGIITSAEAKQLVARAGTDQWRLSNELDKLLAHGINTDAIETLVEPTLQANVFALLDAVLHKKSKDAAKHLTSAKITEDPYMLFGLFSAQLLQLAALVYGGNRSVDDIAKQLNTHPFPLKKLAPLAKKMSFQELKLIVDAVVELDNQLKSTGLDPWLLLEQTLTKIAHRQ